MSRPSASLRLLEDEVRKLSGLVFPAGRRALLLTAVERRAREESSGDVDAYARAVLADKARLAALLEELTVKETYFLRESAHFDFIRHTVLPAARHARPAAPHFRAWSAGCSTGEEAYTLAVLLTEEGLEGRCELLASDLSERALERARAAEYSSWALRGTSDADLLRYLTPVGNRYRLDARIRRQVRFFPLNLAEPTYPSPGLGLTDLDVILCRNVLIYFDERTIAEVARRLLAALAPGGWLLTAASDPVLGPLAGIETVTTSFGVAYRRPEAPRARPLPPVLPAAAPTPSPQRLGPSTPSASPAREAPRTPPERRSPAASRGGARPPGSEAQLPCELEAESFRSLADAGLTRTALARVDRALKDDPMCAELHFVDAVLRVELGRLEEALASCQRALYLEREQPFFRFYLAWIQQRLGWIDRAEAGFRRTVALCGALSPDASVAHSEGMTAATLEQAARFHLAQLGRPERSAPGGAAPGGRAPEPG